MMNKGRKSCFLIFLFMFVSTSKFIPVVESAKILSIEFVGTKSHVMTYIPLLDELARRGHQVTLMSPSKGLPLEKSIREIFTFDSEEFTGHLDPFKFKEEETQVNPFTMIGERLPALCKKVYQRSEVQALMNETFDLVILQPIFNACALGLVHKVNAPLVLFTPFSIPNFVIERIGGYFPPSFVSNPFLGYPGEMNFPQRMLNFGANCLLEGIMRFYFQPIMQETYHEVLGQDVPSVREIIGNASLALSNGHFSITGPKPYLPDVIDVGGIHCRPPKPLPKDLEHFISEHKSDGFIMFSLGSAIQADKMPEEKRQILLKVFSKLKVGIIWKWESERMPNLPKNVKLVKWIPQQDLLGHKSVKIFITHCGTGGVEEAIYHGVPLLGIPFYGDQYLNAKNAKTHGILVELDWNSMTEQSLLQHINELLNNPKYSTNVKRLSKIFKDQPESPLQRGVYWIEYVIRHKGAPHLKSASRKLNTFQYHSVDVILTYLAIILSILYLILVIFRFLFRRICRKSNNKIKIKSVEGAKKNK